MWSPGSRVAGRYEILSEEGESAAYQALRALDREVEVEVELWVVKGELLPDAADRNVFLGDAERVRALAPSCLRRLFAFGEEDGSCWVALARIEGPTLAGRLAGGRPMPDPELRGLAHALGDAL